MSTKKVFVQFHKTNKITKIKQSKTVQFNINN